MTLLFAYLLVKMVKNPRSASCTMSMRRVERTKPHGYGRGQYLETS